MQVFGGSKDPVVQFAKRSVDQGRFTQVYGAYGYIGHTSYDFVKVGGDLQFYAAAWVLCCETADGLEHAGREAFAGAHQHGAAKGFGRAIGGGLTSQAGFGCQGDVYQGLASGGEPAAFHAAFHQWLAQGGFQLGEAAGDGRGRDTQ